MEPLHDPARHEPLADLEWSPARTRDAIAAICRDAEATFDPARLWPLHPGDYEPGTPADGIMRGVYIGAAGMLDALARLAEAGLHVLALDGVAVAGGLHEAALASPDQDGAGAPVARNAGLCHGTTGNGFAFLALLERTGDELWLARARAFAMHALDQVARFRATDGRGRYTLFTGDIGAALLAAACLRGDAAFPGLGDWF
jgi:hypothetical protein